MGKVSACNAGDLGLIPGLGRSPGEGNGNPLQYLVATSWTRLSDFPFLSFPYQEVDCEEFGQVDPFSIVFLILSRCLTGCYKA